MIVSIDMLFPTKISGTFFVVCLEAIGFPVAQKAQTPFQAAGEKRQGQN
jgi:hypothetical protein